MTFQQSDQAPLHRVGGHVALDFVNTVSWTGTARETDHIADVGGLVRWAADAGLIDRASIAVDDPDRLIARAHLLRRALRNVLEGVVAGSSDSKDRAILLGIAAESMGSAELIGIPARLHFKRTEDAILGGIASAAIDLLRGDRLGRLKICAPDNCRWIFLDTTKNGSRRWCDMGACGNRSKVTHLRARRSGGGGVPLA